MQSDILKQTNINQRGFVPIIILIAILIASAIGAGLYIKQHSITPASVSPTPQPNNSPSPTPTGASKIHNSPVPKPTATYKPQSPTPKSPTPTPKPTTTPTPATTSIPKSSCGINAQATLLDPNSSFDDLLTVQLIYSVIHVGDKYMTGAQWDFDGNGSWDTDMTQSNGSISHTFPGNGNYNVKLQLKMSDGEITPVCAKTITVPMGFIVRLTGQVFSDANCNSTQEPDEQGVAGVTINIFRMPEFSLYTTITSDGSGYYNLTRIIDSHGSLTIQPGDVAAPGYKINASRHTVTLNSSQSSINQNLPQVPNENIELCTR